MPRLSTVIWWKRRPHLRHLYSSVDPRAADQASILTAKSWVSKLLAAVTFDQPRLDQGPAARKDGRRPISGLAIFKQWVSFDLYLLSVEKAIVQQAERQRDVSGVRHLHKAKTTAEAGYLIGNHQRRQDLSR
jgi:hypothetical protein